MFSNSTNAKRKQTEKISVCTTDFVTNTCGDLQISTPNSLCLDGLNCGIPTRTTPTLTPTTLRNIEQTFIELQGHTGAAAGLAGLGLGLPVAGLLGSVDSEESGHQAGFMPPVIQPPLNTQGSSSIFMNLVDTKSWQGGTASVVTIDAAANSSSCSSTSSNPEMLRNITSSSVNTPTPPATPSSTRKNVGGRRPNRDNSISPEEEEKRKQRRERNKQAAARCRKRRLDHTNELLEETEGLESKKMILQSEIQQLQQEKDELEFLLETHKAVCRRLNGGGPPSPVDVKPFLEVKLETTARQQQQQKMAAARQEMPAPQQPGPPRPRPTTLPVVPAFSAARQKELAVPITTPTSGVHFNFDSLMEGGTGLTPVSGPLAPSSCSSQQRSQVPDLSSPDSVNTKLVSL